MDGRAAAGWIGAVAAGRCHCHWLAPPCRLDSLLTALLLPLAGRAPSAPPGTSAHRATPPRQPPAAVAVPGGGLPPGDGANAAPGGAAGRLDPASRLGLRAHHAPGGRTAADCAASRRPSPRRPATSSPCRPASGRSHPRRRHPAAGSAAGSRVGHRRHHPQHPCRPRTGERGHHPDAAGCDPEHPWHHPIPCALQSGAGSDGPSVHR